MADPVTPTVHVFTDDQFKELMATVTPTSAIKTGAEDILANIKVLLADVEGTATHVHGAAKQLQADVKANKWQIIIGLAAFASLAMHLIPFLRAL